MPDKKISELDAITGSATAADDFFIVVDSSGASTNKISRAELNNAIEQDVLENISITNLTSDLNTNGNDIKFGDNDKAIFGAGSDLQIYHNGTNSVISDSGTGNLNLLSNGTQINLQSSTEYFISCNNNGPVTLYYDGSPKLSTTNTGISITGNATFADNGKAIFGDGSDLQIYHDSSNNNSYIYEGGTGSLYIGNNGVEIGLLGASNTEYLAKFVTNGQVELMFDNDIKLATTATGVDVNGTVTADGLTVDGTALMSTTNELQFFTSAYGIRASTGLEIKTGDFTRFLEGTTEHLRIASGGNVGIGTSSPSTKLHTSGTGQTAKFESSNNAYQIELNYNNSTSRAFVGSFSNGLVFAPSSASEAMRIDSSGNVMVGRINTFASTATSGGGSVLNADGLIEATKDGVIAMLNRNTTDGSIVELRQDGVTEGTISVSGTTVSYNGGHLSRWSRLSDDSKDTSIVKGTVMTNLDEMVEWSHETTYWTDEDELPVDEDGNPTVSVGDVKTAAYVEDNEQLNKMAVSSVEGDANVAGVFVNWDDSDDWNDMNVAMTGDMVIRIASGTTVARGDLLMSAGDGTAKPQGDDIVRSKTIAKVTSTHVSHTYDDGSYLVPCVLMAC